MAGCAKLSSSHMRLQGRSGTAAPGAPGSGSPGREGPPESPRRPRPEGGPLPARAGTIGPPRRHWDDRTGGAAPGARVMWMRPDPTPRPKTPDMSARRGSRGRRGLCYLRHPILGSVTSMCPRHGGRPPDPALVAARRIRHAWLMAGSPDCRDPVQTRPGRGTLGRHPAACHNQHMRGLLYVLAMAVTPQVAMNACGTDAVRT